MAFDYDIAANAVSESNLTSNDDAVCARYSISISTLRRWKTRAKSDDRLASLVKKRCTVVIPTWKSDLQDALRSTIEVLVSQIEAARGKPEFMPRTTNALMTLGELAITTEYLAEDDDANSID